MKKIFLLFTLFFIALSAYANELVVIDLKHRSADDLLPIIRPLLDENDVASGMNYQLILRTSPRNLAQIKKLLQSIDTAPRRLKITVMQNVDSETVARLTEMSGSVGGNARVTVPGSGNTSGLNVEVGQGQNRAGVHVISTRSLEDDRKTQQLQVLEGSRALVRSGQNVPVPQRQVIQRPWGTEVIDSTQYQDVSSGFYVLPRVNGDNVTLEITAQNDSLAPNQPAGNAANYPNTRTQQAISTVSGRLGEWIEVGGTGQQGNLNDGTISSRSTSQANERRNVLIKVEEVK
ncbi:MAG TPA: hypothetical protein VFW53_08605 [Gallionella sp.]|nr:hypothetical protein [Gallionella sp.]